MKKKYSGEGRGATGAEALLPPPTFKKQGRDPPINVFYDVISHIMLTGLLAKTASKFNHSTYNIFH